MVGVLLRIWRWRVRRGYERVPRRMARAQAPSTCWTAIATFAGSDGGAKHWAVAMTLIQTAKLNGVDPMVWLTDVLERIVSGNTRCLVPE